MNQRAHGMRQVPDYRKVEKLPFFVYGTLRVGCGNYYGYFYGLTENEIRNTTIHAKMWGQEGSIIPYITPSETNTVTGDLLYVPDDFYARIIQRVDRLEGYSGFEDDWNFYLRRKVEVTTPDGIVEAWAYFANETEEHMSKYYKPIVSGDYLKATGKANMFEHGRGSRRGR